MPARKVKALAPAEWYRVGTHLADTNGRDQIKRRRAVFDTRGREIKRVASVSRGGRNHRYNLELPREP
jgi:hypothetical protein